MTSTHERRDFDALLEAVLPRAGLELRRQPGLVPFAATVSNDGIVVFLAVARGSGGSATETEALDELYDEASDSRDILRAVAIAAVVHGRSGDFVRIEVERRDADALIVIVPFRRLWPSKVSFGRHTLFTGTPRIWQAGAATAGP